MLILPIRALCLTVLTIPAWSQAVVYVDPQAGDDAASGTSEMEAFRTLTHALSTTPGPSEVRLLPGVVSPATGEGFPIQLASGQRVVGVGGPKVTEIEPPAGQTTFAVAIGGELVGVRLRLPDGNTGLTVAGTLQSVEVEGGRTAVESVSAGAVLEGCLLSGQSLYGVDTSSARLTLRDTTIRDGFIGVYSSQVFGDFDREISAERCRIIGNESWGLFYSFLNLNPIDGLLLRDCLIAGNGDGVACYEDLWATIEGCTIAGNGGIGLTKGSSPYPYTCRNSVFAGNGVADLDTALGSLEACLVQDGSGPSSSGKIVADPAFVDVTNQDFSLGFASPCIDAASVLSTDQDLEGRPRKADGNLDLVPASDIGALEHQTLAGPATVALGQAFEVGVTGAAGKASTVFLSLGGFAPFGQQTPFGRFFLPSQGLIRVATVMTGGAGPTWLTVPAVTSPTMAGSVIALQAATRSDLAPAAAGFSNPLGVLVLP